MANLTSKQKTLLRKLKQAIRLYWHWIKMDNFIELEAFEGHFQQYTSAQAHLDPDKAKADKLGRRLLYLRDAFGKAAIAEGQELLRIAQQCKAAGIPEEVISKHITEPPNPPIRPAMQKLPQPPYEPSKRVRDYARMRRRPGA